MELPVLFNKMHNKFISACKKGDVNDVREFLNSGIDVDSYNIFGQSCLPLTARSGNLDLVKMLVDEFGADVDQRHFHKKSALHEAADKGHLEIVDYLLENQADPNNVRMFMNPALHKAVRNGHEDVVKALLEHGANPFAHRIGSDSPFEIAVEAKNSAMIKAIFDAAIVKDYNHNDNVDMHSCKTLFNQEIISKLLENSDSEIIDYIKDELTTILNKPIGTTFMKGTCAFYDTSPEFVKQLSDFDADLSGETTGLQDEI